MRRLPLKIIHISVFLFLVISCTNHHATLADGLETHALNDISTTKPTETPYLTDTPSPSPTPDLSRLNIACVDIIEVAPSSVNLGGVLIIVSYDDGVNAYLWDLVNDTKIFDLALSGISVVSPDYQMVASEDLELDAYVMWDSAGNRVNTIPLQDMEGEVLMWRDTNLFVVEQFLEVSPYDTNGITLLDIQSKQRKILLPEYPGFLADPAAVDWGYHSHTGMIINPQQTHILYPGRLPNELSLIVWDLGSNQEVHRIYQYAPMVGVLGGMPQWFSDGIRFVTSAPLRYELVDPTLDNPTRPLRLASDEPVTENTYINLDDEIPYSGGYELISVSTEGDIQRLSFLTTNTFAIEKDWVISPDEKKIAFWLYYKMDSESLDGYQLAVLDISTGEVAGYCIEGYDPPIWSPDSTMLAINQNPIESTYMIVDLEAGAAYNFAEEDDVRVAGWMISPP
jgi:hypothetical protein